MPDPADRLNHNGGKGDERHERAAKRLEEAARKHGFAVRYDGLWPTLVHTDGRELRLPS